MGTGSRQVSGQKSDVHVRACLADYQKHMRGIDLCDQIVEYFLWKLVELMKESFHSHAAGVCAQCICGCQTPWYCKSKVWLVWVSGFHGGCHPWTGHNDSHIWCTKRLLLKQHSSMMWRWYSEPRKPAKCVPERLVQESINQSLLSSVTNPATPEKKGKKKSKKLSVCSFGQNVICEFVWAVWLIDWLMI